MPDFFISYNKADRKWAEWIVWQLEEAGYSTMIQAWDFRPASDFIEKMNEAITETERTIAVLSPDSLKSRYAKMEWNATLAKGMGKLLPVRVKECTPIGLLATIGYLDLTGCHDEEAAKRILLDAVKSVHLKSNFTPCFPGLHSVTERTSFPGALLPALNAPHMSDSNLAGHDQIPTESDEENKRTEDSNPKSKFKLSPFAENAEINHNMSRSGNYVFICYARTDKKFVFKLEACLKNRGVLTWLDKRDIPNGADWDLAIDTALKGCEHFLIVLSPASVKSYNVRSELLMAFDEGKHIVPILYQACNIPRRLRLIQYTDFSNCSPNDVAALNQVLHSLTPPKEREIKS